MFIAVLKKTSENGGPPRRSFSGTAPFLVFSDLESCKPVKEDMISGFLLSSQQPEHPVTQTEPGSY